VRLNKITTHAIRILSACAEAGSDLKKAADIAVELDLTQQNTVKIIHGLIRAGFLQSARGRNGGVRLAYSADNIYIGAVVRETEAGLADANAGGENPGDGFEGLVDDAFAAFLEVLDGQTLADLVKTSGQSNVKKPKKSTGRTQPVHSAKKQQKSRVPRGAGPRS